MKSRYTKIFLGINFIFILGLILINLYVSEVYNQKGNQKIDGILTYLVATYPDIEEEEILQILDKEGGENILLRYGLDSERDSFVEQDLWMLNVAGLLLYLSVLLCLYRVYMSGRRKKVEELITYIHDMNHRTYEMNLMDYNDNELNVLKNELYQLTVQLKEEAITNQEGRIKLKDSLADISHQLKTPLTSMLIRIENQEKALVVDKKQLREMRREIVHINDLIIAILKLARFDAGVIEFKQQEVKAASLVEGVVEQLSLLSELKDIQIVTAVSEDVMLHCDPQWQIEALSNIVKNAIEHAYEGTEVKISVEQNQLYTTIEVQNYGKVIEPNKLKKIFERFYRTDEDNKNSIGIGLALSKRIIMEEGGLIRATSDEKEGTKFEVKYFK